MALNDDVDLALLLVAIVEEVDGAVGPVGLAKQLHRDEALEHGSRDGTIVDDSSLVGADEVGEHAAVDDVGLGALDLAVAEVDVPGLELADKEQVLEDLGVRAHGVGVQFEVSAHAVKARQAARPCGDDEQQPFDVLHVAHVGDVVEVSADDRGYVAGEEPGAPTWTAALRFGISTTDERGGERSSANQNPCEPRELPGEEIVDELLANIAHLAL